jgi:hypothetical protein
MIRRFLTAVAAAAALLGLAALPAAAQYDDPTTVTSSAASVVAGGTVEIEGSGFAPGSTVEAVVVRDGQVTQRRTGTADASGDVSFRFRLARAGTFVITLSGRNAAGEAVTVSTTVEATGDRAGRSGDRDRDEDEDDADGTAGAGSGRGGPDVLAFTGGGSLLPLWAGIGLLGAGLVTLAAARTRKRHS